LNATLCCVVFIVVHQFGSYAIGVGQETEAGGAVGAGNVKLICEIVSYKKINFSYSPVAGITQEKPSPQHQTL